MAFTFRDYLVQRAYELGKGGQSARLYDATASGLLREASEITQHHAARADYFAEMLPDGAVRYAQMVKADDPVILIEYAALSQTGEPGPLLTRLERIAGRKPLVDAVVELDRKLIDKDTLEAIHTWKDTAHMAFLFTVPTLILSAVNRIAQKVAWGELDSDWPSGQWPKSLPRLEDGGVPKMYCPICGSAFAEPQAISQCSCGARRNVWQDWPRFP